MAKRKKLDAAAILAAQNEAAKLQAQAQAAYMESTECDPIASAEDAGLRYWQAKDSLDNVLRRIIADVPSLAKPDITATDPAAIKWRTGALRAYAANLGPQWIVRSERGAYSVIAARERPASGTADLIDLPALTSMTKADWKALEKAAPQRHAALLPISGAAHDATRKRFGTFKRQIAEVKATGKTKKAGRPKGAKTGDTFTRLAAAIKGLLNLAKAGSEDGSLNKDQAGTIRLAAKSLADIKPSEAKSA